MQIAPQRIAARRPPLRITARRLSPEKVPARPTAPSSRSVIPARVEPGYGLLLGLMMWTQLGYSVLTFSWGDVQATGGFQANPVYRSIKVALLILGLVVIFSRMRTVLSLLRGTNSFFLAFLALIPLSILWSIDPDSTAARCVTVASMITVCLSFNAGVWRPTRLQDVIRPIITLILLASLIAGLIAPDFVLEQGDTTSLQGAWHGLASQKNIFGMLASYGVILWLHAWLTREHRAATSLTGFGICATCLVLSRSSTSLMATAFVCLFQILVLRSPAALKRYRRCIITLFAACTLAYGCAVMSIIPGTEALLTPISAVTGKDTTFSARTQIWAIVGQNIARHPYVGSGYNAYWGGGPVRTSPSYQFLKRMYFWPSESHNGYVEIRNDLGYLGIMVLFGYFYVYLRQSLQLMRFDRNQAVLFLALFFQQAVVNLSESTWFYVDNFSFAIMSAATIALARSLHERRRAICAPPAPTIRVSIGGAPAGHVTA